MDNFINERQMVGNNSHLNARGAGSPVTCLGPSITLRKPTTCWPAVFSLPVVATGYTIPFVCLPVPTTHGLQQPQEALCLQCSLARVCPDFCPAHLPWPAGPRPIPPQGLPSSPQGLSRSWRAPAHLRRAHPHGLAVQTLVKNLRALVTRSGSPPTLLLSRLLCAGFESSAVTAVSCLLAPTWIDCYFQPQFPEVS